MAENIQESENLCRSYNEGVSKQLWSKMETYSDFDEFNLDLQAIVGDYMKMVPEGPWKLEKLIDLLNSQY